MRPTLALALTCLALTASAQTPQPNRVSDSANLIPRTQLAGHIPAWAVTSRDTGVTRDEQLIQHVVLVLTRSPAVEAAFQQLLLDQHNPSSYRYHRWLTPQQTGELYGASEHDIAAVSSWLEDQGLVVEEVAANRLFITFSGSTADIDHAFSTEIHNFSTARGVRYAPAREPSVPAAFTSVLHGFVGLSEQAHRLHSHKVGPNVNLTDGLYGILPADFATIYDINPVYASGINGTGQRVAILGASRITPTDVSAYESLTALPSIQPTTYVIPGYTDPGATGNGQGGVGDEDQMEATHDVDRVVGTAPGAAVDLLLAATNQNLTDAGILAAINYNTSILNDAIVTMSFGRCEVPGDNASSASFNTAFSAGVAQGISFFVSSGDAEAAGCADAGDTYNQASSALALGPSTNILCGPYVTCVGGTQFSDTTSPSTYWAVSNGAGYGSAISYIPEGVWNEPLNLVQNSQGVVTSTGYVFLGGGGGPSIFNVKPAWQSGPGVPADGFRDTPDVSFSASGHNGYVVCAAFDGATCSPYLALVSGTSAAAPAMAGIAAMLNQKLQGRQGNLNPLLYTMSLYSTKQVLHDALPSTSGIVYCSIDLASTCNSSTPGSGGVSGGIVGFPLTVGFDNATGLGSLDVANFLEAAAAPPALVTPLKPLIFLTISPSSVPFGQNSNATITVTGPSGMVIPTGEIMVEWSSTVVATGRLIDGSATLLISPNASAVPGVYTFSATYAGDSVYAAGVSGSATLTITGAPNILITSSLIPTYGNYISTITFSSVGGFSGVVSSTCRVAFAGLGPVADIPTCSLSPASVSLSTSATSLLTVSTTAPHTVSFVHSSSINGFISTTFCIGLFIVGSGRRLRRLGLLAVAFAGVGCSTIRFPDVPIPGLVGTTAGPYVVTVTGTSGTLSASTTVSFTVQ